MLNYIVRFFRFLFPIVKDVALQIAADELNRAAYSARAPRTDYYRGANPRTMEDVDRLEADRIARIVRDRRPRAQVTPVRQSNAHGGLTVDVPSRLDAVALHKAAAKLIAEHGQVTVAEIYKLSGDTTFRYSDENSGWTSLTGTHYKRKLNGVDYEVIFPEYSDLTAVHDNPQLGHPMNETLTKFLANECPDCHAAVGDLCNSDAVWIHLDRMKLIPGFVP